MRDILYYLALSIYWLIRRALQVISIICLIYWCGLLGYLFLNGVGNDDSDLMLVAFAVALFAPPILAALLWSISEWFKA